MRPVMRNPPLCTLHELSNGTYSLDDLADFHEAMDEEEEYLRRFHEREEAKMRRATRG
jgi:hypothetical protein